MNPLVSIITPCYNGENHIFRFLDSILNQTYSNIEFIFVNDGSSDKTEEIVLSYKNKFEPRGIKLIYIYQENQGVSAAINAGLKRVNGKYLCWPDSDDYLELQSIEKRVDILEKFPDYAIVTSDAYIRNYNNLNEYIRLAADSESKKYAENQFELLLSSNSMLIPGPHMVRMNCFIETHPTGQIYPYRRGQNWQMLLPIYYKYKRYFLDEPLYNYIIYPVSITHGNTTKEGKLIRIHEHEDNIINILNSMDIPSEHKIKYIHKTHLRYIRERLTLAFHFRDKILFKEQYNILEEKRQINRKEYIYNIIIKNKISHQLFSIIMPFIRKLFKISILKNIFYNKR